MTNLKIVVKLCDEDKKNECTKRNKENTAGKEDFYDKNHMKIIRHESNEEDIHNLSNYTNLEVGNLLETCIDCHEKYKVV